MTNLVPANKNGEPDRKHRNRQSLTAGKPGKEGVPAKHKIHAEFSRCCQIAGN